MTDPIERTTVATTPPRKRTQTPADTEAPEAPQETAEERSEDSGPLQAPVPIPGGADTALTVEQISVRRRAPSMPAVRYDGSNAVQVGAWVLGQNRVSCRVDFRQGKMPVLVREDGTEVARGWILPNLEVVSEQDLTTVYERLPDA